MLKGTDGMGRNWRSATVQVPGTEKFSDAKRKYQVGSDPVESVCASCCSSDLCCIF
jgi:hypothetical protein